MKRKSKPQTKISVRDRSTVQQRHNSKHTGASFEKHWTVRAKEFGEMIAPYVGIALAVYNMCRGE